MLLDTVTAWARLREVKLLGVRLALDDFGTGFSSLSFVRQFSVDMIKIDRSFVQGVTMNAEDRAIVAAVAGIANGLGLACVAEGVETKEQALELRALGMWRCCRATSRAHPPRPSTSPPCSPPRASVAASTRAGFGASTRNVLDSALSGETAAMRTRVTDLLGVEHPIVQAPMGWIARAQLASAVSNAGGLGIIETSSGELDAVRGEIVKMRDLTDKPFGVNIAQLFVRDPKIVDFVVDQGVKFVTTSAGDPTKYTAPAEGRRAHRLPRRADAARRR